MILRHIVLAFSFLCAATGPVCLPAQTDNALPGVSPAPVATAPQTATPAEPQKPSALIAPAVDHLGKIVSQIQLERWKGNSRDETDNNLRSIEHDLSDTLPGLVTTADAQPASLVNSLPVLRNLDALCAVVIRVSVVARTSAPTQQADSISGALTTLQSARNTLYDQVLTLASAQEKQITALRGTLTALSAKVTTPPPPPPTPVSKSHSKKRPIAKPKPAQQSAPETKPAQP